MHRPTKKAAYRLKTPAIPALAAVCLLLHILFPHDVWAALAIIFGGMWLLGYLWAYELARGLHIRREHRFGWNQVGDVLEERFTLSNASFLPVPWMLIEDHSSLPGYKASLGTGIGGMVERRWRRRASCERRGVFSLGPTTIHSGDMFNIYAVEIHYPASSQILITPPVVPLPQIDVAPGGQLYEGRAHQKSLRQSIASSTTREYMPGDSLRWIHWPTTARQDKLHVRMFEHTPSSHDWWIFLDMDEAVHTGEGEEATDEHAIILAASLTDNGLRHNRSVGLAAHSDELVWLPPERGEAQFWQILRALALIERGPVPLERLLGQTRQSLQRRTSAVIITPSLSPGWLEALPLLIQRQVIPTVLLLESRTQPERTRAMKQQLEELGVSGYLVPLDIFEHPDARPGRDPDDDWRVTPLGRAVLPETAADRSWKEL